MAGKRRWFLLGVLGAIVGLAVRLVRGRREDEVDVDRLGDGGRSGA